MNSEEKENLTFALLISCAAMNAMPTQATEKKLDAPTTEDVLEEIYDERQRRLSIGDAFSEMQSEEAERIRAYVNAANIMEYSPAQKLAGYNAALAAEGLIKAQSGHDVEALQAQGKETTARVARVVMQDRDARILATQTLPPADNAALQQRSKDMRLKSSVRLTF
jgi:hypothetical protein